MISDHAIPHGYPRHVPTALPPAFRLHGAAIATGLPAATQWQGTSTVNWFGPGQNLATAAILSLGGDRQLTLRGGVARAHVVVDVTAYVA